MNPNMMNRNISYYGANRNRMGNRGNCDTTCGNDHGNNCGHEYDNHCNSKPEDNCCNVPIRGRDQGANCSCMNQYMEVDRRQLECMNQQQLLCYLQQVSFSMYDATLFLDTHPCDREAMAYFNNMQCARKLALEIYQKKFGPMLLDGVDADCEWTWGMQPLPWEPMC